MLDQHTETAHHPSARTPRPIGTWVLTAGLLFLGLSFAGAGIQRTIQDYYRGLEFTDFGFKFQITLLGLSAVVASVGLMFRHGWGWWAAVTFTYLLFDTFVLAPPFHRNIAAEIPQHSFKAALCIALLLYLLKRNVRDCLGIGALSWRTLATLFVATSATTILALRTW